MTDEIDNSSFGPFAKGSKAEGKLLGTPIKEHDLKGQTWTVYRPNDVDRDGFLHNPQNVFIIARVEEQTIDSELKKLDSTLKILKRTLYNKNMGKPAIFYPYDGLDSSLRSLRPQIKGETLPKGIAFLQMEAPAGVNIDQFTAGINEAIGVAQKEILASQGRSLTYD